MSSVVKYWMMMWQFFRKVRKEVSGGRETVNATKDSGLTRSNFWQ